MSDSAKITLFKNIASSFLRLNISQKMHLGFLPLVVLLVIVSTFSLGKLNQLTSLNESILQVDIPVQEAIRRMKATVIDQESILRRYLILKDEAFLKVFRDNSLEFAQQINLISDLSDLSAELDFPLLDLEKAYSIYAGTLLEGLRVKDAGVAKINELDEMIRVRQAALLELLSDFSGAARASQDRKVAISASIGSVAFKFALGLCVIGIALSAAGAAIVTNNIINSVKKLHCATEAISQGNFDYLPDIHNKDELGDLAKAFIMMGKRLKDFEEMYLDASPLTRLPGGVTVENMLKKIIGENRKFAFCLLDIDNFKSFNDHYGYALGNEMIQNTATIIEKITAEYGVAGDFVGHIGGDDFVVITNPDKYKSICQAIIAKFDEKIPALYSDEDRSRGFIAGVNRQGEKVKFKLASISIAVVTNQNRAIRNHIEVGEIAAELKEKAKAIAGSSMVADHRHGFAAMAKDADLPGDFRGTG